MKFELPSGLLGGEVEAGVLALVCEITVLSSLEPDVDAVKLIDERNQNASSAKDTDVYVALDSEVGNDANEVGNAAQHLHDGVDAEAGGEVIASHLRLVEEPRAGHHGAEELDQPKDQDDRCGDDNSPSPGSRDNQWFYLYST